MLMVIALCIKRMASNERTVNIVLCIV